MMANRAGFGAAFFIAKDSDYAEGWSQFAAWPHTTLSVYECILIVGGINDGIATARTSGTRFGGPPIGAAVITDNLALVNDGHMRSRTAAEAADLVG